jgi:D-alanyl-D-alanine carboxypeptidase (penicillin-binding protein 5/6)
MEQSGKKYLFDDFFQKGQRQGTLSLERSIFFSKKRERKRTDFHLKKSVKIGVSIASVLIFFLSSFFISCVVSYITKERVSAAGGWSAYAAMEQSTGRVLYGSNLHMRLPMASTTKIMTAITVIESGGLEKKIKVPRAAVGVEGSSIYLKENEEIKTEDLLYGLMLMSGNDSAAALAIATSGSVEKFAELMNKKAAAIGAKNTHFVNPHGLHHAEHYTTAYDLALISAYALKNPTFKKIVASEKHIIPDTSSGAGARYLHNKNKMLHMYEGADGVKTGFTKNSGRCLVSSATKSGMQVVVVVLNCPDMWNDSMSLLNRSFENYKMVKLVGQEQGITVRVENGTKNSVTAAPYDFYYPISENERVSYEYRTTNLRAPVKKGENAGKIIVSIDNRLLFEQKMVTIDSVKEKGVLDHFKDFFGLDEKQAKNTA